MSKAKLEADLLDELNSLNTAEQVGEFIQRFKPELEWEFLGGRETNENAVHLMEDPGNALNERVTNAIDACLERAVHEGEIEDVQTPREAVEELWGLSKAGYTEMPQNWVTETARNNINVSIEENGKKKRPVIQVADRGIGQRPENFEDTFLSLDKDSKLTKPYLIGKYGQGGSSTFRFCEYAIIISRHCDGGDIGWSIVKYDPRTDDEEQYSMGAYMYATLPNGDIPTISEEEASDWGGSIVRLIEYDATDFWHSLTPGKSNLYTVFHRTMFGSLFPFLLEDQRTERFSGYDGPRRRSVVGSRYRLDKPSKYVHKKRDFRRVPLNEEYGTLRIKYWVLDDRSAVKQFVDPTEPIVFTLHGQRHYSESKRFFTNGTDYNFLKDRIIVEVNCDELTQAGQRAFTSNREGMSKSDQGRIILKKVIEALDEDEQLEDLNDEYQRRAINETTSEQEERAKELLADLLQNPQQGDKENVPTKGGDEDDESVINGGDSDDDDDGPDELYDYPTYVEIVNKQDPIPAKQGRTLRVEIEADVDWLFEELDRGEITLDLTTMDALTYERETSLEDGRKYIYATVDENTEIGEMGTITAVAEWEDGRHEDERTVKIAKPSKSTRKGRRGEYESPDIQQITREDSEKIGALSWDETDVAEFHPDEGDSGRVYVSMFNQNIQPVLQGLPSERKAKQYKSEYTAYMAYFEVMRKEDMDTTEHEIPEDYMKQEQNRVATVLMRQIVDGMTPEVA